MFHSPCLFVSLNDGRVGKLEHQCRDEVNRPQLGLAEVPVEAVAQHKVLPQRHIDANGHGFLVWGQLWQVQSGNLVVGWFDFFHLGSAPNFSQVPLSVEKSVVLRYHLKL